MSEPVVALLLGLALLATAAWLLLKYRSQDNAGSSAQQERPSQSAQPTYQPNHADQPVDTPAAPVHEVGAQASERSMPAAPESHTVLDVERPAGRRKRKAWALANECEFLKSDAQLANTWPHLVLGRTENQDDPVPAVRDVVSGFYRGYPMHIGDINRATVLAMRRAEPSPVHVVFSKRGELPHGLRRAQRNDQGSFYAFTTDVQALDRMMDPRVLDALAALERVADHIEWHGRWLYIRIGRKIDPQVWDKILPYQYHMANASLLLPPMYVNVPLEFDNADPTRPLPGSEWSMSTAPNPEFELTVDNQPAQGQSDTSADQTSGTKEADETPRATSEAAEDSARPRHLQAVPDSPDAPANADTSTSAVTTDNAENNDSSDEATDSTADIFDEDVAGRPDITRPAEKVEFPTRSKGRTEGEWGDGGASAVGDTDQHLPKLGEDPEHIRPSTAQRPHVLRADADREPTIFDDVDEPELDYTDPEEDVMDVKADIAVLGARTPGKHRAPDARHARPEPIEPVDIETVEAEVVDIRHNKATTERKIGTDKIGTDNAEKER